MSDVAIEGLPELAKCPFCGSREISPSSWDVKCSGCGAEMPGGTERAIAAWNRRTPASGAGVVKALEWHKYERSDTVYADTLVGRYCAWAFAFDDTDGYWMYPDGYAGVRVNGGLSAAKAAAQADYEARILSALPSPPLDRDAVLEDTDHMRKAILDKMANEGGGTWAAYMWMEIEEYISVLKTKDQP